MNALLAIMVLTVGLLVLSGCGQPDRRELQYGSFACGWGGPCDSGGPVGHGEAFGGPLPRSAPWPHALP